MAAREFRNGMAPIRRRAGGTWISSSAEVIIIITGEEYQQCGLVGP